MHDCFSAFAQLGLFNRVGAKNSNGLLIQKLQKWIPCEFKIYMIL